MTEIQVELIKLMIKAVIHQQDGWEQICEAIDSVYEAGLELGLIDVSSLRI